MTGNWFPFLDPSMVERVNRRIDNPTATDVVLGKARKRMMGNTGFAPGLWTGGHRQYNHDMFTMIAAAYQEAGLPGVQAGMAHIAQDVMSDYLTRALGQDGAMMFEAAWLLANNRRNR